MTEVRRGVVRAVVRPGVALVALVTVAAACSPAAAPEPPRVAASTPPEAIAAPGPALAAPAPSYPDLAPFEPPPEPAWNALPGVLALGLPESKPVETGCNEQPPQEFLKRSSYVWRPDASPAERAEHRLAHHRAVEYRTRQYGYVEGAGDPSWNRLAPKDYARDGSFFGVHVRMNNRVLTALGCVEKVIAHDCADAPYAPRVLDGLRARNTFHNDEVSNHLYGIAIDLDPDKNSCCGCVPPLSEWPRCKKAVSSPFERAAVPKCWVDRFERYGFYWLGYDQLEDTMHFEFLGDPGKIIRKRG